MYKFEEYIEYLNSLHNATATNENAIVESQIDNKYYNAIAIRRDIGEFVYQKIQKENCCIILTGHAGDGKTSLLAQVLKDIDENFRIEKIGEIKVDNKTLFYIKDMSEIEEINQKDYLQRGIEEAANGNSSIIIANTGPLIKNFKYLFNDEIESLILSKMDSSKCEKLDLEGYPPIYFINIAKIDNTNIIPLLIDKMLDDSLWSTIRDENKSSFMYKNFELLYRNKKNVSQFITNHYRYLYESGERYTLRQIVAHLAYGITGNYNVSESRGKNVLIYNFANFFFGYEGDKIDMKSEQIKGIRGLRKLAYEFKRFNFDESLFLEKDFNKIDKFIKEILLDKYNNTLAQFDNLDKIKDKEPEKVDSLRNLRALMRRFYILYNSCNDSEQEKINKNLFNEVFLSYLQAIDNDSIDTYELEQTIFRSLNKIITGIENSDENQIYLTLKRDGEYIQNVQLIVGEVDKRQFEIITSRQDNKYGNEKYLIQIHLKYTDICIPLNYPLIQYFYDMNSGIIKTNLSPHLSQGVDRIKAKLYSLYSYDEREKDMKFLVLTNQGTDIVRLEIKDKNIVSI